MSSIAPSPTAPAEINAEQARTLTDRIKVAVEGTGLLIQEAYSSRAWATLGYENWDAYCTAEFGHLRLQLPKAERLEAVAALRAEGMSTRAIGSAIGVDHKTVVNDLRAGGEFSPPAPDAPPDPDQEAAPPVTGVDGKTYQAKAPTKRARPKLTSQFESATRDLTKLVARFERLATDDRYRANRDVIAELNTPEIRRAVQVLGEMLRDFTPEQETD